MRRAHGIRDHHNYSKDVMAEAQRMIRQHQATLGEMGTEWDRKKQAVFRRMEGSLPSAKKEEKFKSQMLRFFKDKHQIDLKGFFQERNELPNTHAIVFQFQSIVVYGIDFMSPAKVYHYFRRYGPSAISWVNDSTCKVTFGSCYNARRAVQENLQSGSGYGNKVHRGVWYSLRPYYVVDFQRPLEARIATNLDIAVSCLQKSKYKIFQLAWRIFIQGIDKTISTPTSPSQLLETYEPYQEFLQQPAIDSKTIIDMLGLPLEANQDFAQPFSTSITQISSGFDQQSMPSFLNTLTFNHEIEVSELSMDRSLMDRLNKLDLSRCSTQQKEIQISLADE